MSSTSGQAAPPKFDLEPYKSFDNDVLVKRIEAVRREMGSRLLILGHHYQQDEVISLADLRGDSYGLSPVKDTCRFPDRRVAN